MIRTLPLLMVVSIILLNPSTAHGRTARTPETMSAHRARIATVGSQWAGPLQAYTGGSYSTGLVNQLWPSAPRGHKRLVILGAAVHHHVPLRLLLGIWGAESGFGRYACHFGLTGNFPGRGTSGNFRKDAHMAADILDRLYRSRYGHHAL